jgi:hypothetical protein
MKPHVIHLDSKSVLVSTSKGLIRAYCPIDAICISSDINGLVIGDRVKINSILFSKNHPLLYEVDGKKIPYQHFKLIF